MASTEVNFLYRWQTKLTVGELAVQVSHQPTTVAQACLNTVHSCLLFTENPQRGAGWMCGQASEHVEVWMLDSLAVSSG